MEYKVICKLIQNIDNINMFMEKIISWQINDYKCNYCITILSLFISTLYGTSFKAFTLISIYNYITCKYLSHLYKLKMACLFIRHSDTFLTIPFTIAIFHISTYKMYHFLNYCKLSLPFFYVHYLKKYTLIRIKYVFKYLIIIILLNIILDVFIFYMIYQNWIHKVVWL